MKKYLKYLLFSLVVFACFIITLDALLWLFVFRSDPMKKIFERDTYTIYRVRRNLDVGIPVGENAKGIWRNSGMEYSLRTNGQGLRSPDVPLKKETGTVRAAFLGDSIAFGWDVNDEQAYPEVFGKIWRERHPNGKIDIINAGIPGHSSWQGLILFDREIKSYRPDLVVIEFGIADSSSSVDHLGRSDREMMQGSLQDGWQKINRFSPSGLVLLAGGRPVVRMLSKIYGGLKWGGFYMRLDKNKGGGIKAVSNYDNSHVPLAEYKSNLLDFVSLSKNRGFMLVFFIPYGVPREYRDATLEIADMHGIKALDFSENYFGLCEEYLEKHESARAELAAYREALGDEVFERHPYLKCTTDGGHPNVIGQRLIAEELAELLHGFPGRN